MKNIDNPSTVELSFREILKDEVPPFNNVKFCQGLIRTIKNIGIQSQCVNENIFDETIVNSDSRCKVIFHSLFLDNTLAECCSFVIPLIPGLFNKAPRLLISESVGSSSDKKKLFTNITLQFIIEGTDTWQQISLTPSNTKTIINNVLYN